MLVFGGVGSAVLAGSHIGFLGVSEKLRMISFIHSAKQIVTLENRQFPDNLMVHGLGSDN